MTAEGKKILEDYQRITAEAEEFRQEGKLAEAVAAGEKKLAIEQQFLGPFDEMIAASLQWLAEIHEEQEDFPAAREERRQVVTIQSKRHGVQSWQVVDARLDLEQVDRLAAMEPAQRRQLAQATRLNQRVLRLLNDGKYREALAPGQEALAILKELLGDQHSAYALSLNNLAGLYDSMGDYGKAEPLYAGPAGGTGILTAEEVAGLDLRGMDLAVLSACETGLGEVAGGEGVLGLQRAFQAAGARTLVTSLWKVDDAATALLMEEFYANLWQKKLGKLEALRQTQLTVLHHPEMVEQRRRQMTPGKSDGGQSEPPPSQGTDKDRSPPSLWAAFILSGDIR